MAVLVEGYSVIIRCQEIDDNWPGGFEQFISEVPNGTLCIDGHLVRVGFMKYEDALEYCQVLKEHDIQESNEKHPSGYVIICQINGLKTKVDWLEFGHVNIGDKSKKEVAVCRLVGDEKTSVSLPNGWTYEDSLSSKPIYITNDEAKQRLERIRRRDGVEVYFDKQNRKQVFVGRTGDDKK